MSKFGQRVGEGNISSWENLVAGQGEGNNLLWEIVAEWQVTVTPCHECTKFLEGDRLNRASYITFTSIQGWSETFMNCACVVTVTTKSVNYLEKLHGVCLTAILIQHNK